MASNESYSLTSDSNEENYSLTCTQETDFDMTKRSECIKEMYCEECEKHENSFIPVEGFCEDCMEYKCKNCIRYHRRSHGNHRIQHKGSMPQEFCFERCTFHPKERIKFYCVKCKEIACCECRSAHQNCPNVTHLLSLLKNTEDIEELKTFNENLKKISKYLNIIKNQLHLKTEQDNTMTSRARATIEKHKDKLTSTYIQQQKETIGKFDKEMEETIAELRKKRQELVEQLAEKRTKFKKALTHSEQIVMEKVKKPNEFLESIEGKTRTLINDVAGISNKITQAQLPGQKCQLFNAMKSTKETLELVKNEIKALHIKQDIQCYTIIPQYPKTSLELMTDFFCIKRYNAVSRRNVTLNKTICTNSKNVSSCLCLLSPNKLIESDYSGKCINTIENISDNEQHREIKMPSTPYGIAKLEENKVAVTFPFEGIVRLITLSKSMTVEKSDDITVGTECHGIVYCNGNLIISFTTDPGKVQILDMAGNVLNCFEKNCNGQSLFSSPDYLAISPNHILYVSDWDKHTVTSMTLDGKVKAIYKDDLLKGPCQLTVDESGTVYVCGRFSKNVHQLSSDLKKVKILLDERQEMVLPVSIAYCPNNSRLYVGMLNTNIIEVFNLATE